MTKDIWVALLVAIVTMATVAVVIIVSIDTIRIKRGWIDQCVVQEWESTGGRHLGVRDYCVAKYRQMRG